MLAVWFTKNYIKNPIYMKPFCALLLVFLYHTSFSQSFNLDYNFNCVGKAARRTGGGVSSAMAIQPDGKILVAGRGGENIYNSGYCIVRFNQNGTLDSSFGTNGMVITLYGGSIQSIIVLPDGKILAAGFLGNVMMAKYLPNGTLDSSFGTNGLLQPHFNEIRYSFCYSIKLQPDGKIVMAGNIDGLYALTARFLANGTFDSGFAGKGYSVLQQVYIAFDVALQPDGKIIIGGQGLDENSFMLARYSSDGTLDGSFGSEGIVLNDISSMSEFISSIALLPDGKILAAGRYDYNSQYANYFKTAVIRYNANGSPDNSFGNNSIANLQFDNASADPKKIMLQNDGKILIAGDYTDIYNFHEPMLARFNANGITDSLFGNNGSMVTTQFGDSVSCRSAVLQPDGKVLLGGYQLVQLDTTILYYTDSFFVMRYETNSVLPVTYFDFSAAKQQQQVALNWLTANEINNNYFSVERLSGKVFNELGKVVANNKHSYTYIDNKPLMGTNFYRLKQVDKDGNYSYSKIVTAVFDDAGGFVLYPNPVRDVLNIKGMKENEGYQLVINNAKGNVIKQATINKVPTYSFNVQNIASGLYYLKIISADKEITTIKFVKP